MHLIMSKRTCEVEIVWHRAPPMKRLSTIFLTIFLAACAAKTYPYPAFNPLVKAVTIDGLEVRVAPNADGTWSADEKAFYIGYPNPAAKQSLLTRGVEQVSGCKVVSAFYQPDGNFLVANVQCVNR